MRRERKAFGPIVRAFLIIFDISLQFFLPLVFLGLAMRLLKLDCPVGFQIDENVRAAFICA